jgi:hypothetical protein
MSNCFPLNSIYSEISNNKYIFNNLFPNSTTTNISYGLYDTSNNINYIIRNVSKNYPLTFYDSSRNRDSSNIITFEPLNKNDPILIYVSKGQDYSFNNNDYFRFYDTSFQLLNINHYRRERYDSSLTDIVSNFYFMNNQRYKFIATTDFCSNQPFRIYGNSPYTIDNSLSSVGASFELTIPYNADNNINRLFYSDINTDNTNDVCGNLFILRDLSYSYYYGDISFSIRNYRDVSRTFISVKSYDYSYSTVSGYGTVSISNNNLFYYSESCRYIITGYTSLSYELLNKISAIDLSVNANNTFKVGLNKNRHISNSTFNYDLSYGVTIKDYIIIDISKNYPLRLLNNEISNNIYIDETYQINRLGIQTIGGSKFYYGSLKIKVVSAFIYPLNVQFVSISNNSIDFSYVLTFIYDRSTNPSTINHIVYDSSTNSRSYYDFSNSNLQIRNQNSVHYDLSDYEVSNNIFKLNLNTDYNELGYNSRDKLANDLTQFVSATPSVEQINNELSNNFLNIPFYIYYNVIDYENNSIQNIRAINLNGGPIIEISNNYNNNNNNNSTFAISINTNSNNASIYNFYDDIKVYIYDKSKNKIFIPFEITISGSYLQTNRTPRSINRSYGLTTTLTTNQNLYYPTFTENVILVNSTRGLTLTNIELASVSVYNISNNLVEQIRSTNNASYFIKYYGSSSGVDISLNSSNLNLINRIEFLKVNSPFEFYDTSGYIINGLNSSFIVYKFTYTILGTTTSPSKTIDISLGLSPTKFFFTATDTSLNSFTVSGNFIKPKIFTQASTDSNLIDLSYIGNYDLIIKTESLGTGDYYKATYANKFFTNSITNISKTYKIRVQDISSPSLTFYDISGRLLTNLTYFKFFYPKAGNFNIYNDICFAKLTYFVTVSNDYIDNKPVLLYDDNSIYDLSTSDLSFSVTIPQQLTNTNNIISLINPSSSVGDVSCIINYNVRDLCNNYSLGISLELNFVNIPYVSLRGQSIVTLNYINDLSYNDQGLTFISPSFNYVPSRSYKKDTSISELTDFSSIIIGSPSPIYNISGTCDICFTRLGNYYFKYSIQQSDSTHVLRLQRLIKVVDSTKPFIIFPDLSFIIDGSAGSLPATYNTISNSRITVYNIDNSASKKIDLSFTVNTNINDVSRVLYNFDLCDNYFSSNALSYTIKLANRPNAFVLADISNYYSPSTKLLNKVTSPYTSSNINSLAPLTFVYTLTDGCNNSFTFNRRVDIVDEVKPSITFSFNNIYSSNTNTIYKYQDYSYVQFDSSKKDFSYVAFNYIKSPTLPQPYTMLFDFYQEISSIILGFDLSDNFGIIQKTNNNVTITLSGSLVTPPNNTFNIANPTDNSYINALFKVIGSSFSLIYDISDNQTNSIRVTRNVKIVEYIDDPSLNFDFGYKDIIRPSNIVNISFGDTGFNIDDISVNHYRLTPSDISYDISYIFVNANNTISTLINSISGTSRNRYDPSALIYNLGPLGIGLGTNDFSHNIKYFPVRANRSTTTISNYKILNVRVKNNGPIINFGPNPIINHQSYTPLTDASFIFGVTSYSIYDEFYYYKYNETISYSGTNFKVILDSSLNVNDPSSGTYSIIYYSKDSNNLDISRIRTLIVRDSQAPFIRSICGDNIYIYQTSNNVWSLDRYSIYTEYGALVYDSATKRSYYFDNQTITTTTELVYDFSYKILGGIKYSIRYNQLISTSTSISYSPIPISSINTSTTDICYQVIYSILDLCNNEVSHNRIIKIIQNYRPLLYPYIEVNSNLPVLTQYLLRDLSNVDASSLIQINRAIPRTGNNGGINDISYDLSLSYVNNNNNSIKIITCEAIKPIVFNRAVNSNYIKFKLHAKSYDMSRIAYSGIPNSSLSTYVDYSINSIRVFNSPIDYQPITFTAIDSCQNTLEQQQSITFYLKIIDTKLPNVTKLTNINFNDPNKLDYPLLSSRAISKLVDNINYFDTYENSYLNRIKYYKKVIDASNIVLLDPGINIEDIVDGSVNFVNGVFESSAHTFSISDISLTYFKTLTLSYFDVSNVLTASGQYIQNYNIKDKASNVIDVSRVVVVKPFGPIIRLNYQQDSENNNYTCYLLQRYEKFIEKEGYVRDFSDINDINFMKVAIDYSNLNENKDGSYIVVYSATNSSNVLGTAKRNVEVYSPIVLEKVVSINFVNLITGPSNFNSNSKFTLGIGIYKFDVCANYAFKLVTRDFDTSMAAYDVSNLISLTSALYYNVNGEKYYYGSNVRLTISGDFERCSLKFNPDTSGSRSAIFQSYLKNNEFRYFYIYDNNNYFINLQNYYNNLREPTQSIDSAKSFNVDVSNLNNPVSSPYFTINGLKQDMHLIYGVYRFQQTSYKNFYNPIKFSTTPDGTHNGGIEYTKTVFSQNLPGVSRPIIASYNTLSIYTQITINATTPTILYYYSEKFKNMGGKIVVKNNIVLCKNVTILNSFVITNNTKHLFSESNKFLTKPNEVMRNRIVLNQRFDVSSNSTSVNSTSINSTSATNICCVTQQNLQYNVLYDLNNHPNRLIFKKYDDPPRSNYILANSGSINDLNYLLDVSNSNSRFNDSYNSYITYFNSIYESSSVIIKANGLNNYDRTLKNIFYNSAFNNNTSSINSSSVSLLNNEIINYINFFKRNNVIPSKLLVKDFSYNISEFLFAKQAALLNLDSSNIYNYSSSNSSFLVAPRIKITNIIDNYVMFTLDVDYANLFFQTFEFIVYSSSFTVAPNPSSTISNDRLFFLNGSLVIANNMLYSNDVSGFYDGSSVFNKMYTSSNAKETTMKNMVFLNILDVSSTSAICGITKQNIYNNMYLDESNNFIFHKYNEQTIVNYQVNDANLTLAKTLTENTNNDHYLLDICSNTFYNSFNNDGLTIQALNSLVNDKNYSIALTYKIYDEIDVSINFNILDSLYILPIYLNNIPTYRRINNVYSTDYNYNTGSYSIIKDGIISEISINSISSTIYGNYNISSTSNSNTLSNSLHSNSYIINLNDYFDVDLVRNYFQTTSFSTSIINPNNLIYSIIDINYNNSNFNLYNVESSYNIIFDKPKLTTLNSMQIKLFCLHFKLKYLVSLINHVYDYEISTNSISYTSNINIQYCYDLSGKYDIANTSFISTLSTSTLSILYSELVNNTLSLITFYNELIANFDYYNYPVVVVNPIYRTYVLNTTTIDQLVRDINSLAENIDFVILNETSKFEDTIISSDKIIFTSYSDISYVEYTLVSFIEVYNKSQLNFARWNTNSTPTYQYELFKSNFINLFDVTNLNPYVFLENFKYNLNSLKVYFNEIVSKNAGAGLSITTLNNTSINVNFNSVTNFAQFVTNFNIFWQRLAPLRNINQAFEVASNNIKYINNIFELSGSQLLIHSIVSNSIILKINVKYKSYFFNYIDISTIILDIIIPDLTPPTLTFTNHDFSFNQNDLISSSINNLITNLIRDVSYIDLNQRHDLSINNIYYSYYTDITNAPSSNNIQNSLVSIKLPNIKNSDFITTSALYIDITYIVKDNANNINNIIRTLIINKSRDGPKFYYYKSNESNYYKLSDTTYIPPPVEVDENINIGTLKTELTNFITLIDPRLALSNLYLEPFINILDFNASFTTSLIGINVINIYDLSRIKIANNIYDQRNIHATYDVSNNKFIDYFNFTTQGGQELANISKILLDVGTYTLEYISKASTVTNRITSQYRTLTVNAVIIEEGAKPIVTHCCYPKVEYKPIQDSYKLGSQNSTVMKRVKYIINRNR